MSTQTWAEAAVERNTASEDTLTRKLIFTGRVLVKRAYEDLPVENFIDTDDGPVDVTRYTAPEIRPWVRPLARFTMTIKNLQDRDPVQNSTVGRILAMHELAADQPGTVSIFDKAGVKVDP